MSLAVSPTEHPRAPARVAAARARTQRPLLLINAHYRPDVAATANHVTDLAEHLAAVGYAVEVCTGRENYEAGRVGAPAREERNGVVVRRPRSTSFGRGRALGRLADYASFHLHALGRMVLGPRCRGVVVLTTPPFLSVTARLARLLRGQRYAVWSMDLHPEAEVEAGMRAAAGSPLGRLLFAFARAGYRGADFVVALGPYMRRRIIAHGAAAERVGVVPVWVDERELRPAVVRDEALAREMGLAGKFVVAYMGNAGLVHDFDAVLDAMRELRGDPRVHFLFTGGGPRRPAIEAFAREHGLSNVTLRAYVPREQLDALYALVDVHLVTLSPRFAGVAVPFKGYVSMATGRPVLFVGPARCETADAVREHGAGATVDAAVESAGQQIAARLREWSACPAELQVMGERGRQAVVTDYERATQCRRSRNSCVATGAPRPPLHLPRDRRAPIAPHSPPPSSLPPNESRLEDLRRRPPRPRRLSRRTPSAARRGTRTSRCARAGELDLLDWGATLRLLRRRAPRVRGARGRQGGRNCR